MAPEISPWKTVIAADPIYRVTYNMRTYIWARDVGLPEGPT